MRMTRARLAVARHIILIASISSLSLAFASSAAHAAPMCAGKERLLTVKGQAQTFSDIGVLENGDIRVHVPSGIKRLLLAQSGPLAFDRRDPNDNRTVYLRFLAGSPVGTAASVRVWSELGFEARLDVEYVKAMSQATADITVMHDSEVARERAQLADVAAERRRALEEQNARQRLERTAVLPLVDQGHRQNGPISVHALHAEWEGSTMYVYFAANSHVERSSVLHAVAALDQYGEPIAGTRVYFAQERGEVMPAEVTSELPGVKPVNVLVKGQGQERGLIVIPNAAENKQEVHGIRLYGAGVQPLTETILKGWRMIPITEEEWEREQRAKQTTVSVRGLVGGFWTTAGDDLGGLDGTGMGGVGVRVAKGFIQNLAFEVEAVGGRSGDASFSGMSWGGMTGDVLRQATFGRLQGSGVVRFGDRYVGSMRVGLGLQLASYDSFFTTSDISMEGPGDGFEIDGFLSLGAGIDVRLGGNWSVGGGLSFSKLLSSATRTIESGLHIGYGFSRD